MIKFNSRRQNKKQLRETMKQISRINEVESIREADFMTGYVCGQIELKVKENRLTRKQGDALVDMAFAINEDAEKRISEEDATIIPADSQEKQKTVDYFRQYSYEQA